MHTVLAIYASFVFELIAYWLFLFWNPQIKNYPYFESCISQNRLFQKVVRWNKGWQIQKVSLSIKAPENAV